jgi:hypothetical protein
MPGQFPPLAHNPDLFISPDFPIQVVLFGLKGKISVNGQDFDSEMPPLDVLSDQQIAAAVNYVRDGLGNSALRPKTMGPVDAAIVAELRRRKDISAEQVFANRKQLKAGAARR